MSYEPLYPYLYAITITFAVLAALSVFAVVRHAFKKLKIGSYLENLLNRLS